jgi:hypothetical protein
LELAVRIIGIRLAALIHVAKMIACSVIFFIPTNTAAVHVAKPTTAIGKAIHPNAIHAIATETTPAAPIAAATVHI